ncbi:uncharacterized protein N7511_006174 [Penicillium nucicola]|uniref:uncharacterized protein n=1 Tax=Penicillium nucicola TaxID=1850975 RepID=UPI0025455549|nr:uncharacterized protein N7511_006174 [Penicillium nucicola]KAJ5757480.1 hypothetical protein N7511_006174 [Penicillium nucicola]
MTDGGGGQRNSKPKPSHDNNDNNNLTSIKSQMFLQTLFRALLVIMSAASCCAMMISPRTAIREDELDRYDAFMENIQDDHYVSMFLVNGRVKVDLFVWPSDTLAFSDDFTPSPTANEYFEQQDRMAEEMFGPEPSSNDTVQNSTLETRDADRCTGSNTFSIRDASILDDERRRRPSRCGQFCGGVAHCRGNNGCPRCHSVRMGCRYQKQCVVGH